MFNRYYLILLNFLLFISITLTAQNKDFQADTTGKALPWSTRPFENNPRNFQFAVVSDRTGGHREGVFEKALEKLNLLHPEFVMSVGDFIEGYTKDRTQLDKEWAEWDGFMKNLNMRFFALPGNHDISNGVMRNLWLERYGRAYYHYVYKDVLFIAMDTNDDQGVIIDQAQVDYVKKALSDNPNVRWTMLFMHHPVWNYKAFNGFGEIEAALQNRKYTVFAGHNHGYLKAVRNNRNYYILATTGGGSRLRGPRFQEFDQVSWITMTDNGPEMINLAMSGLINDDVVDEKNLAKSKAILNAVNFQQQLLQIDDKKGLANLTINNTGNDTLHFEGKLFHHHQLMPDNGKFMLNILPNTSQTLTFQFNLIGKVELASADPFELDWQLRAPSPFLEPPFALEGTLSIPIVFGANNVEGTTQNVFSDQHTVELKRPKNELPLRYTLDGSTPTAQSPIYKSSINLKATTNIKARFFTPSGDAASNTWEKEYRKTEAKKGLVLKGLKPGLSYKYYEGTFPKLPNFSTLKPVKQGIAQDFKVDAIAAPRLTNYAFLFEGWIEVPEDGIYNLYTYSDDGSKLYIYDQLVVDNDGWHRPAFRTGYISLKKGLHPLRLEYFQDNLGLELQIGYLDKTNNGIPFTFKQFFYQP
jgi:hypothetical protein